MRRSPNSHWRQRIYATGRCFICLRRINPPETRRAHRECARLVDRGRSILDVRAAPPTLGPIRPKSRVWDRCHWSY